MGGPQRLKPPFERPREWHARRRAQTNYKTNLYYGISRDLLPFTLYPLPFTLPIGSALRPTKFASLAVRGPNKWYSLRRRKPGGI